MRFNMDKIRVLIADDHAIVRMGLRTLFESKTGFEVVGEAKNGDEAVKRTLKLRPDIVIMDLLMPVIDGIEATRILHEKSPSVGILILTTSTIPDNLSRAIQGGARGIVIKTSDNGELLQAVREVHAGKLHIPADIANLIDNEPSAEPLTARQREILQSMARGLSNTEIARQFGISYGMSKKYVATILKKLGAANRSEATALAVSRELVKVSH